MKSQFLKSRLFLVVTGAALSITGIVFILNPAWLAQLATVILGSLLVAIGMLQCIFAFVGDVDSYGRKVMIAQGLANVVLGALFFLISDALIILLGITGVVNGVGLTFEAFRWRKQGFQSWISLWLAGLFSLGIGVVLIYFANTIAKVMVMAAGGIMIIMGATLLLVCFTGNRKELRG